MNLVTNGIIIDQRGELLVVRRNDTRTWAAPGGNLDFGESPEQGVTREVEEETGFKVLPVRLVRLDHFPIRGGTLQFTFRCLIRGGEAKTSLETTEIGFVKTNPIPVRVLPIHKIPIEGALKHSGGSITWHSYDLSPLEKLGKNALLNVYYPLLDIKRRVFQQIRIQHMEPWQVSIIVVAQDGLGNVFWRRDGTLPTSKVTDGEAPWEAAGRLLPAATLIDLVAVYSAEKSVTLVFSAETVQSTPQPTEMSPLDREAMQDALDPHRTATLFKSMPALAHS